MATRAQIIFTWHWSYDETVKWLESHAVAMIYKHNDGDTLKDDLINFLRTKPFSERFNDPVYLSAMCLHYLCTLNSTALDDGRWPSLGITNEIHGDTIYVYWFDCVWEQLRVYEQDLDTFDLKLVDVYKFEDYTEV